MKRLIYLFITIVIITTIFFLDINLGLISYASNYSNTRGSIYTKDGLIFLPDGNELVMRGVNTLDVYYLKPNGNERIQAINRLADMGVNSIRILWDIEDDLFDPSLDKAGKLRELRRELEVCRDRNITVMLTLHHFRYIQRKQQAGDPRKDFQFFDDYNFYKDHINYWINDAKNLLDDFTDIVIVNILNEPSGGGTNKEMWLKYQKQSIIDMRNGGIKNCLAVDSWDWGKNFDILYKHGQEILNADVLKNTIFDIHAYYYPKETPYLGKPSKMREAITKAQKLKLPFVYGEVAERNFDDNKPFDVGALLDICNELNVGYMAFCLYSDDPFRKNHTLSHDNGLTFNDNWSNLFSKHGKTLFDYINENNGRELVIDNDKPIINQDSSAPQDSLVKAKTIGSKGTELNDNINSTEMSISPPLKSQADKDAIYNILLVILSSSLMGSSYWMGNTFDGALAIVRKGKNGEPNKFLKPSDISNLPSSNNKDAEIIDALNKEGYVINDDGSISKELNEPNLDTDN